MQVTNQCMQYDLDPTTKIYLQTLAQLQSFKDGKPFPGIISLKEPEGKVLIT